VQKLFKEFEKLHQRESEDGELEDLARQICNELTIHAQIEEEIFYPALRESMDEDDLLNEAQVEHDSAKALIAQIEEGGSEEMLAARVQVLAEYVNHHINEEQNEIFPAARKAKVVQEIPTGEQYGFAFNKQSTKLRDAVNKGLKEIKDDGQYSEIYKKWFGA
jgi:hemerythrin-like domain-containing protein